MILRVLATAFLVLAVLAAGLWFRLDRSLPKLDGEVAVQGLGEAVEIVRDREGVPHIHAKSERDGWFAMGYVHAQDRLWQMEFQRRVATGRLAEILGERAFDSDRLMRTLGFARLAGRIVENLDAETRAALEAYAAGVNAMLAGDPSLPPEFMIFGVGFEPWKSQDTVAWLLVMAWDLSGNWRAELNRLRFAAKLGPGRVNEFLPPYPGDAALPIPDFRALYELGPAPSGPPPPSPLAEVVRHAEGLHAVSPGSGEAIGSNSWVLAGSRTASGKPILANDPHLGLQTPALWYLAHVATPRGNVVGGTLPGAPFMVLGRNDRIAWSMTTTGGDTQDLYVERVAPDDPGSYLTPTGRARFEVREESIRVKGESRPIRIRSTRHGPVISDVVRNAASTTPPGHVIALAWSALTETNATSRAGLAINRAQDAKAFIEAARDFHAPQQNLVYADSGGRVGMVVPALVPRRHPANEAQGRYPVPGWIAKYDWQGFLPYEELPAVSDPESGQIVTANHKTIPAGYRAFIAADWFPPFRAQRIEQLLSREPKHSRESTARIQADTTSRLALELLPAALSARPATQAGKLAQAQLAGWDGAMAVDQAAPLAFAAWYRELSRLVYADELGELFTDAFEMRGVFMITVMRGDPVFAKWCDNVATPQAETCAELAGRAFDLAAADLEKRYGHASRWRWGEAHRAASPHRPLGFFPVVGAIFSVTPETPGDTYSVNVGHVNLRDEDRPFANRHGASLRAIYDFADLERSLFMHSTGQSGNVLSPWYRSLAERWARVEYIAIPTRREAIAVAHVLALKPRP